LSPNIVSHLSKVWTFVVVVRSV